MAGAYLWVKTEISTKINIDANNALKAHPHVRLTYFLVPPMKCRGMFLSCFTASASLQDGQHPCFAKGESTRAATPGSEWLDKNNVLRSCHNSEKALMRRYETKIPAGRRTFLPVVIWTILETEDLPSLDWVWNGAVKYKMSLLELEGGPCFRRKV